MVHETPEAHRRAQAKYQKKPEQVKKREARNTARRTLMKEGKVHKGDGKDIDHKDGDALNNKPSNWRVVSKATNRSFARDSNAHKRVKST